MPTNYLSPEGRAELRRLDATARKGPWAVYRCSYVDEIGEPGVSACGLNGDSFDCSYDECHHPLPLGDAEFMAAARTALPQLLAALEEAEGNDCRPYLRQLGELLQIAEPVASTLDSAIRMLTRRADAAEALVRRLAGVLSEVSKIAHAENGALRLRMILRKLADDALASLPPALREEGTS